MGKSLSLPCLSVLRVKRHNKAGVSLSLPFAREGKLRKRERDDDRQTDTEKEKGRGRQADTNRETEKEKQKQKHSVKE